MTVFGIEETTANKNKFVPHYKVLANKLYPSEITLLNPRSVMFTREAFKDFDFWNLDSDFFFAEDALSFNDMLNYGSNHFAYFSLFMKVLRMAHSHYDEDFLAQEWTKNKAHVLDMYSNMMIADVVMVSPVLKGMLEKRLAPIFSDHMIRNLESKYLVLPPPDFYKFHPTGLKPKSFKTLTFLWNHRFVACKNAKLFFGTIAKLVEDHPRIPVKVMVLSSLQEREVLANIPEVLHPLLEIRPYAYDDEAYAKALEDSNITLGSSLVESYGIAILEVAKYGGAVLNFKCNEAYSVIIGDKTTFAPKEMVDKIVRFYDDPVYRKKLLAYTAQGLSKITSAKDYRAALKSRLRGILEQRLDRTSAKSPKLAAVVKALSKKAMTKNEVYEVMGWKSTGAPINTFWGDYYYGLRKLGVQTIKIKGRLYFYTDVKPDPDKVVAVARPSGSTKNKASLFG